MVYMNSVNIDEKGNEVCQPLMWTLHKDIIHARVILGTSNTKVNGKGQASNVITLLIY
jgi:hypothetical protein